MTTTLQDDLIAILGPAHVRVENNIIIVSPANTEEIAAILRHANQHALSVMPQGAGTKQAWSNAIDPAFILSTERLTNLVDHTWQDMTCTVQAGCTWAAMQTQLTQHGQFVALDPLWPDRATIGGIVATNDSGALRHRYGSLRDLIIGMTLVLPDGTIARTGGKVVKNVAGYDLHKLMTGAYGTLGVITQVTFRLHSIPRHTRSLTIAAQDAAALGKLLHLILDSQLSTQALQLRGHQAGFFLDIQLAAMAEVLAVQSASVAALAAGLGLPTESADPDIWTTHQSIISNSDAYIVKATMLPSAIPTYTEAIRAAGGASVAQAVGVAIASVPAQATTQILALRHWLEAERDSLTILVQPVDSATDRWGTPPDTLPLMREIKQRFDPNRILNPGRYIGGI